MLTRHKRTMEEWQREIQKIDLEIAERNQAAKDRLERMKLINPNSIVVIFDAQHGTGFLYKNRPFWRTILGPAFGIVVSSLAVEILQLGGFSPSRWPQWSLLAFYLPVLFLTTAVTNHWISQKYDHDMCAMCGGIKNSWDPLCKTCWDDYRLQQVSDEVPKLIERFIKEERERDKERESHPPELFCSICRSRLQWDVGWNDYICAEHGDIKAQSLQNQREFLREEIRFIEKLHIG